MLRVRDTSNSTLWDALVWSGLAVIHRPGDGPVDVVDRTDEVRFGDDPDTDWSGF
ncbi:hypothetical protein GGG17_05115 [Arsenicicoccus sp. MKL-02]|uniref:Uncharacterized protein n=1 Tax=Arsenicicoccus cauae TaxID=2663847 RepID=A0A6I3IAW1_9MICO|nr:hypothetical protein [Arsenicicoccus cauae]MTB71358.1 hypothetical protein [Arsenicicoccus cauae]